METKVRRFHRLIGFSCNVYLVHGDKGTVVIDPGFYGGELPSYLKRIGGPDAVLLTHGHWDHLYGLDELKADFPSVPVYLHERDRDFLTTPELNGSARNGFQLITQAKAESLSEGVYHFGGYAVEVISSPGHTKGSCLFHFPEENLLFTGDSVLSKLETPTFMPTGSDEEMWESFEAFAQMPFPQDMPVYPGHGGSATFAEILRSNPALKRLSTSNQR